MAVVNFVASGWHQMESSGCVISTLGTQQPRKHSSRDRRSSASHPASPCHIKARHCAVNKNSLSRSSVYHQPFSSASISSASKHVHSADWVQNDWKRCEAVHQFLSLLTHLLPWLQSEAIELSGNTWQPIRAALFTGLTNECNNVGLPIK